MSAIFFNDVGDAGLRKLFNDQQIKLVNFNEWDPDRDGFAFASFNIANRTRTGLHNFICDVVPEEVISANRAGKLGIILDNSGEANKITEAILDDWYDSLDSFGADIGSVIYVSQDVRLPMRHSDYRRAKGLARGITICYYHKFLKLLINETATSMDSWGSFESREREFFSGKHKEKRGLCLMHKVRPIRIQLALSLIKSGCWGQCAVSFGGFESDSIRRDKFYLKYGRRPNDAMSEFMRFRKYSELRKYIPELEKFGRIILDGDDPLAAPASGPPKIVLQLAESAYLKTRFSLVSETEMGNEMCRFTEKSIKPFANYHPFVVFGNPYTLDLLRSLGFRTFHEIIDESYDTICSPDKRFDAAFSEVERLCSMDDVEWAEEYRKVLNTLKYNAWHFFHGLPEVVNVSLDRPFLKSLELMAESANSRN